MSTDSRTQAAAIPGNLAELEAVVRRDLALLNYPERDWVIRKDPDTLDVLIIGGGQGGLATAFGLIREKVNHILVIDENPEGHEGPWRTFARMHTLRTPKYVIGPDHGIASLTIQNWYESQHGLDSWEALRFIPKETWADYLSWYRRILNLPVQNNTKAGAITWQEAQQRFAIPVTTPNGSQTLYAQKVVLATGIDGSGRWDIPGMIRDNLPKSRYAHTREDIDFEMLRGKKVAVLGAGASAFDNASVALESGVGEIHLFFRREKLPNVNPYRWAEFVGFLKHHGDLPDAERWRFILQILRMGQLPPSDTYERACRFNTFHLRRGEPFESIAMVDDQIQITTPKGTDLFDYLIIGTGFVTDLSLRPELEKLYSQIALWSDRYTPPDPERHADLGRHPYLGPSFEFQEKVPGTAPYLSSVYNYTFGCLASLGFGGASISGMKYSQERLIGGITRQFYQENAEAYWQSLLSFDLKEFEEDVACHAG